MRIQDNLSMPADPPRSSAGIDRVALAGPAAAAPSLRRGRPLRIPSRDEITDDTPLRLEVAAIIAFPDNSMTDRSLRGEIDRGRLVGEKIAGRWYTSLAHIDRMREKCRQDPKDRVFISAAHGKGDQQSMSSSTAEKAKSALVAARMTIQGLKRHSPNT
jgi:hypothetical protein